MTLLYPVSRKLALPLLPLCLAVMISGCPDDGAVEFIVHEDMIRKFVTYAPPHWDGNTPLPLVIALHEFAGTGIQFQASTGLNRVAEREGFVVLYPYAVNRVWRFRGELPHLVDDVSFIDALIDEMMERYAIDPDRVYVTGLSEGALLAQQIGCVLSGRIAAIAPVAGVTIQERIARSCYSEFPPAFLGIHGTDDGVLPFDGQQAGFVQLVPQLNTRSVSDSMDFWRRLHECGDEPTVVDLAPVDPEDPIRVQYTEYPGCDGAVALYTIVGGKHTWPDSAVPPGEDPVSRQLNASEAIWEFFAAHPRN